MTTPTEDDCDRADIARDEWKDEKVQEAHAARLAESEENRGPTGAARVLITRPFMGGDSLYGIAFSQVCVVEDATDEEILAACNRENPSGTTNGWATVCREASENVPGPVKCEDHNDRLHILVGC